MSSREPRSIWLAIAVLIAGLGVSTLHAHTVSASARDTPCGACVLSDCQASPAAPIAQTVPAICSDSLAIDGVLPAVALPTNGPAPTRGPPSRL